MQVRPLSECLMLEQIFSAVNAILWDELFFRGWLWWDIGTEVFDDCLQFDFGVSIEFIQLDNYWVLGKHVVIISRQPSRTW
jgi:hypothetical protein